MSGGAISRAAAKPAAPADQPTPPAPGAGENQLDLLRDVTGDACRAADADSGDVLEHAAVRVVAALGVELVAVFEYRGPRRRLLLRAGSGWAAGAVGAATVSGAPDAPVGLALVASEPVIIGDLRTVKADLRPSRLLHEHGVIGGVEAAIDGPQGPWGVLAAYSRRPRPFTSDDVDFLSVVANTLALALDRDKLAELLQTERAQREQAIARASRAAERRTRERITQLLHDEALQSLLLARQQLALAAREPERRDCVTRGRDGVQRAIRELRGAVGALHPVAIEDKRLREAIQAVAGHQARQGRFEVAFDLTVEPGEDCALLLLSVVRELTANVAQHARACHARVRLCAEGEVLVLEVCDDGVGIEPGRLDVARVNGHIGLASVTRRVRALGGELTVHGGPDGGTRVRVVLPGRAPAVEQAESAS